MKLIIKDETINLTDDEAAKLICNLDYELRFKIIKTLLRHKINEQKIVQEKEINPKIKYVSGNLDELKDRAIEESKGRELGDPENLKNHKELSDSKNETHQELPSPYKKDDNFKQKMRLTMQKKHKIAKELMQSGEHKDYSSALRAAKKIMNRHAPKITTSKIKPPKAEWNMKKEQKEGEQSTSVQMEYLRKKRKEDLIKLKKENEHMAKVRTDYAADPDKRYKCIVCNDNIVDNQGDICVDCNDGFDQFKGDNNE